MNYAFTKSWSEEIPNRLFPVKEKFPFAFETLRIRHPTILTQILDALNLMAHNQDSSSEKKKSCKFIISNIQEERYRLRTDKELTLIKDNGEDVNIWNDCIKQTKEHSNLCTYWSVPWIMEECYMYRKLRSFILNSGALCNYDPFEENKRQSFSTAGPQISHLCEKQQSERERYGMKSSGISPYVNDLLKLCLWGNKCDLSLHPDKSDLSEGKEGSQLILDVKAKTMLLDLENNILTDHTDRIMSLLCESKNKNGRLDIILDNAGFELFTDLLFADWVIFENLFEKVVFHVKSYPWFVSDVMKPDFIWAINEFANLPATGIDDSDSAVEFGQRCKQYIENGKWEIKEHKFWTLAYDFQQMVDISPDLYDFLKASSLVILKGDLNYRKLLGDRQWAFDDVFASVFGPFNIKNLCAFRTLKSEILCGVNLEKIEAVKAEDKKWLVNGKYGVIQCNF